MTGRIRDVLTTMFEKQEWRTLRWLFRTTNDRVHQGKATGRYHVDNLVRYHVDNFVRYLVGNWQGWPRKVVPGQSPKIID